MLTGDVAFAAHGARGAPGSATSAVSSCLGALRQSAACGKLGTVSNPFPSKRIPFRNEFIAADFWPNLAKFGRFGVFGVFGVFGRICRCTFQGLAAWRLSRLTDVTRGQRKKKLFYHRPDSLRTARAEKSMKKR